MLASAGLLKLASDGWMSVLAITHVR
jgi:hypothetical protein